MLPGVLVQPLRVLHLARGGRRAAAGALVQSLLALSHNPVCMRDLGAPAQLGFAYACVSSSTALSNVRALEGA